MNTGMRRVTGIVAFIMTVNVLGINTFESGTFLVMMTEGQRYVLSEGQTLTLLCNFHADHFNLFDYPVLWKKAQYHEEHNINIMGNLNQPFVETKRFQVDYSKEPPAHRMMLTIMDVVPEDSGNYTCEVRGPQSKVIKSVMHDVYVTTPIKTLTLTSGNASNFSGEHNFQQEESKHSRRTTMIEGTMNALYCTAFGGYPAPELTIKLGKQDITPEFHLVNRPVMTGKPGLRLITHTTERWTNSFIPKMENHDKRLKCIASMSDQRANATALKLEVLYAPKIDCVDLTVVEGETNAVLRCQVYFNPEVLSLVWIIDDNGTTIAEGETFNEYWILTAEQSDNFIESQLFMRRARSEKFRTYTIVVENSVAAASQTVELKRKVIVTPPPRTTMITEKTPRSNPWVGIPNAAPSTRADTSLSGTLSIMCLLSLWICSCELSCQR